MAPEPLFDLPAPIVGTLVLAFFTLVLWLNGESYRRHLRAVRRGGDPLSAWLGARSAKPLIALARRWPLSLGIGAACFMLGLAIAQWVPTLFVLGGVTWLVGAATLLATAQGAFARRVEQQESGTK